MFKYIVALRFASSPDLLCGLRTLLLGFEALHALAPEGVGGHCCHGSRCGHGPLPKDVAKAAAPHVAAAATQRYTGEQGVQKLAADASTIASVGAAVANNPAAKAGERVRERERD